MRKTLVFALVLFIAGAASAAVRPRRVYEVKTVTATLRGNEITVVAEGRVNTGGWSNPQLVQTGKTATTLTFELVAEPPAAGMVVSQAFVHVEATRTVGPLRPPFAKKVKVIARTNAKTVKVK